MDRNALLLGDAGSATRILEIGPSHAPVAAKRAGWNAYVVDHADAAELRAKYAAMGVDTAGIEEVDTVWHGGRLDDAIPEAEHGTFGRLIASHVIEHIPDPVGFLASASRLLAPGGVIALAVPDKRYCFDLFKPVSTTGDLLAAHDPGGPGRHTARTQFHQVAYSALVDGTGAWGQHPVARAALINTLPEALRAFAETRSDAGSEYVDAHAWQFTPSAFCLAILELAEAGLIDWHIAHCTPAMGAEFIAILHRGRLDWPNDAAREAERLRLLLAIQVELRQQIDLAVIGGMLDLPLQPADPAIAFAIGQLRARLDAQDTQLAGIARILAPPSDTPAELGTLADLTARLDAQQRALATIVAEDGTQASIMRALADIAIRQEAQQAQIASLGALASGLAAAQAAQHEQISSITAANGTQAHVMAALAALGTRQTHLHEAIDNAARAAMRAPEPVLQALAALSARLDAQDARLDQVQRDTGRLARLLRPFLRLRARLTGRPFVE
jgi:SAM-dependent methyltransferase